MTIGIDLHKLSNHSATRKAKLDTGAQGNILPLRLYRRMYPEYLKREAVQQSPTVLTAYGGRKIKQHGKCAITCEFNRRRTEAIFFITEAPPIIGLNLFTLNCSLQKNLAEKTHPTHEKNVPIKDKDDLVKQYAGCFDGIGKFQGQYHITGDPSMPPVARAQRRVPLNLREDIKHEVDDMSQGIIMKLKEGEQPGILQEIQCSTVNML